MDILPHSNLPPIVIGEADVHVLMRKGVNKVETLTPSEQRVAEWYFRQRIERHNDRLWYVRARFRLGFLLASAYYAWSWLA